MSVAILQFMTKIRKPLYGTVRFAVPVAWCLTVVRMRTQEVARELTAETEHAEHCLFCSANLGVLVESSFFYSTCVVFIDLFAQLKQEEWISFLNE
jgi:hypothetical protein